MSKPRVLRKLPAVIGSLINAACILLAGVVVWTRAPSLSVLAQRRLQVFLGVLTLGLGFHVFWLSLPGGFGAGVRQAATVVVALVLGKFTGRWLGVQARFNRLGQFARDRLAGGASAPTAPAGDVFAAVTVVFCLTPLAVVGPLMEGLRDDMRALVVKGVVDGLATLSLARTRGWPVVLGAVPVCSLQGSFGLLMQGWREASAHSGAGDAVYGASGFLLVATAMVMLEALRLRLADYLPALVWAALLGWLWL